MSLTENQNKIVYSDDPKDLVKMSGQDLRDQKYQIANDAVEKNNYTVVFRIEKNGRGGKTVTVVDQFPPHENFIKELTKEMKSKCGVGGSYNMTETSASIEIQGDKREAIKKILEQKKIKFKGV